jgi:hypothetical protein
MIFLLRKIRNNMIKENKVFQYLLYAVGEILLVVMGILIAVSIDDWSDANKRKAAENKILREISTNLDGDLEEIRDDIWGYNYIIRADSALIASCSSSTDFNDLLGSYAYALSLSPHFNPSNGGYKLMESKGIDIISNDSLRIHLSDFYERSIPYYWKYERERVNAVENIFIPFTMKHFTMGDFTGFPHRKLIPNNYEVLRKNNEWLSLIQTSSDFARIMLGKSKGLESDIIELNQHIKGELDQSFEN